ncbi:hypothetical protein [Streptomyces sp. NPDC059994]|uniref:hypothetical protein n=2 Tax=unclassified Streptomyces TaxID=2593676 RepID=UPI0036AB0785
MRLRRLMATGAIAATLAVSGLAVSAAPSLAATSTASMNCSDPRYLQGSAGHHGVELRCFDARFRVVATCQTFDHRITYTHYGTIVAPGGTSIVWCDLGANVVAPLWEYV